MRKTSSVSLIYPSTGAQLAALRCLGWLQDTESIPLIQRYLEGSDKKFRVAAAQTLIQMRHAPLLEKSIDRLVDDDDTTRSQQVVEVAGWLGIEKRYSLGEPLKDDPDARWGWDLQLYSGPLPPPFPKKILDGLHPRHARSTKGRIAREIATISGTICQREQLKMAGFLLVVAMILLLYAVGFSRIIPDNLFVSDSIFYDWDNAPLLFNKTERRGWLKLGGWISNRFSAKKSSGEPRLS